jgi:ATP-dependent DNA ligase
LPGVTASAIRLITRNGFDWAARYTLVVNAVAALKVSSCLIDGKITVCDHSGVAVFGHVLQRRHRTVCQTRQGNCLAFGRRSN